MDLAKKKLILLSSIIISFVIILVLTFLFAEYLSRKNAPEKLSDIINKVNLIDHNGQPFKSATLKNKPSLLFFGFTNCPEICPTTLADLSEITKKITLNDDSINIIFVTLDPKRDNKEHLKDYIEYFDGNIIGVTGNKIEIKKFADNWGVFYETIKTTDNNYTLNHTATVYMIDKLGNFRGTISWDENESSIIQKINNLRILN
jgi:protein SCO1/2